MTPSRLLCISLLLLAALLSAGCASTVKSLGELGKLHSDLTKKFGDNVNINLANDKFLIVTFINSALNDKDDVERLNRATITAAFIKENYPSVNKLDQIWINFMSLKTRFLVVTLSQGIASYGFDRNGKLLSDLQDQLQKPQYAKATYNSVRKQTDVLGTNLQLEGDEANGLSVTPRYTLPGDISAENPSVVAPKIVDLDFVSSSDKSMFPGAPKITFLVDNKVVYESTEQFSTSKYGDKFSETLDLQLPYATYLRMTNGNSLVVRIGDREYAFSREQHDALLSMRAFVKE